LAAPKLVRNGRLNSILLSHMDTVPVWVNLLNPVRRLTNRADCNQHRARLCAGDRFWYMAARQGTRAELLLAFWASIGFKPGDFMTTGMNEKRTAWLAAF
jgi:hypothetical protein